MKDDLDLNPGNQSERIREDMRRIEEWSKKILERLAVLEAEVRAILVRLDS